MSTHTNHHSPKYHAPSCRSTMSRSHKSSVKNAVKKSTATIACPVKQIRHSLSTSHLGSPVASILDSEKDDNDLSIALIDVDQQTDESQDLLEEKELQEEESQEELQEKDPTKQLSK
jgi:hypothetical protein